MFELFDGRINNANKTFVMFFIREHSCVFVKFVVGFEFQNYTFKYCSAPASQRCKCRCATSGRSAMSFSAVCRAASSKS